MRKNVCSIVVMGILVVIPIASMGQSHLFIDVPSGKTYSDTTANPPAATVDLYNWEAVTDFGDLTGSSVRSMDTGDFVSGENVLTAGYFEVKLKIPAAGEWFLWASYSFPYPDANTVFVLNPAGDFIGSTKGPSVDPVPFLNCRAGDFNQFFWGGADAGTNAVNDSSVGAPLGALAAGDYVLQIYTGDTFEQISGGSGSGATADYRRNPHIEMLFLSNGGATDRPSDEQFLALRPVSGERVMNPPVYSAQGGYVNVTVTVKPETRKSGAATVTEIIPSKLKVDSISTSTGTATNTSNTIKWEIPDLSATATLSYRIKINSGELTTFRTSGSIVVGSETQAISGQSDIGLLSFFIFETFSFPANGSSANEGKSVSAVTEPLGGGNTVLNRGWATAKWESSNSNDKLDTRIIDAGIVQSQPQELNPGNFSIKIDGDGGDFGIRRSIPPVTFGEVWISFTFVDEGPAASHWAGMSFFDSEGNEQTFVGKPWNGATPGLGNLPGGDIVTTNIDYKVPHHYLVRYVIDPNPGKNDDAFLWIDPDSTDRLDTYDAGGKDIDEFTNFATLRLSRGAGSGKAGWWDNIFISSVPALPPAGSGRVDLNLNPADSATRSTAAFDVISIDQFDDGETGPPFGHDNGDNHYLIVSGFLYWEQASGSGNQLVGYGLPPDRMSGLNGHLLEPYNNQLTETFRNSFKFENNADQVGPFTLNVVPPGKYAELHAAMTVANGDGQLIATFNYKDGTTGSGYIHADDWYNDPPNLDFVDTFQLVNGMNRLDGSDNFDGRFNPAVFENVVPIDSTKELVSVTLELDTTRNASAAYNLFSILAVPKQEEETAILDWMLLE